MFLSVEKMRSKMFLNVKRIKSREKCLDQKCPVICYWKKKNNNNENNVFAYWNN